MQRELFCSALSASSWPNQAGEDSIILNWCSTLRMTTQNSMDVLTAKTRPSLSISRPLWWWNGCNQAQRLREPAREPESTLGTMKWRTNVLNCVWPSTSTSEIRFSRRQLHIIATAHGVSSFPPTTQNTLKCLHPSHSFKDKISRLKFRTAIVYATVQSAPDGPLPRIANLTPSTYTKPCPANKKSTSWNG